MRVAIILIDLWNLEWLKGPQDHELLANTGHDYDITGSIMGEGGHSVLKGEKELRFRRLVQ